MQTDREKSFESFQSFFFGGSGGDSHHRAQLEISVMIRIFESCIKYKMDGDSVFAPGFTGERHLSSSGSSSR